MDRKNKIIRWRAAIVEIEALKDERDKLAPEILEPFVSAVCERTNKMDKIEYYRNHMRLSRTAKFKPHHHADCFKNRKEDSLVIDWLDQNYSPDDTWVVKVSSLERGVFDEEDLTSQYDYEKKASTKKKDKEEREEYLRLKEKFEGKGAK